MYEYQSWKFALSLIRSLLFCSKSLNLNFKERQWANRSCRSFKKNNISDLLVIRANCSLKTSDFLEKNASFRMFLTVVHWFPPILCPRANRPRCASLSRSFLKIDGCNLLLSPFTKERPWVNCSHWFIKRATVSSGRSRQKSDGGDSIFLTSESLFRSQKNEPFAQKTNEQIPNPAFLWVEIGEILKIFTVN